MNPDLVNFGSLKCIGRSMSMSLTANATQALWQSVMPTFKESMAQEFYSLQIYPEDYFRKFSPQRQFEKWALVAADEFPEIPAGMAEFEIPGGLYAKFYLEDRRIGANFFNRVFTEYIPQAGLELRSAPHFEILPPDWSRNPELGEWVMVPVQKVS